MSKQCKIVEDLLPLYHDGVCSEESRELVDAHLVQCEDCRKTLEVIDSELLSPATKDSDIDLLKSITAKILLSKRKALIKGVIITLALILTIFLYNSILWYAQEYTYYTPFTEGLSPISPDPTSDVVLSYYLQDDVYTYSVIVPDFLSRSGQVRISKNADESTQHFVASIDKRGYEKYAFTVSMLCEEPDKYHLFIIDGSLNLNKWHYKHLSDSDKAQYQAELEKHKEEIKELVTAAKAIWPFIE